MLPPWVLFEERLLKQFPGFLFDSNLFDNNIFDRIFLVVPEAEVLDILDAGQRHGGGKSVGAGQLMPNHHLVSFLSAPTAVIGAKGPVISGDLTGVNSVVDVKGPVMTCQFWCLTDSCQITVQLETGVKSVIDVKGPPVSLRSVLPR